MAHLVSLLASVLAIFPSNKDAGEVELCLIPPVSVSDKVTLDARAGIRNDDKRARCYHIRMYMCGSAGERELVAREKVRLGAGESFTLKELLPMAGRSGNNRVELAVRRGLRIYRGTQSIWVTGSEKRSLGTIDGAWAGLYHWSEVEGLHWNPDIRTLTAEDWKGMVRSMHNLGMDIVVVQELFRNETVDDPESYGGLAYYPSELYPGRMPIACEDPLEAIMSEADGLGMHVMPGIGLYEWFNFSEASLDWHRKVTEEVFGRYGHHASFYGFYVSEESGGSLDHWEATAEGREFRQREIVRFFEEYTAFCRKLAPAKPVMLATNSFQVEDRHDTYAALLRNLDILCPFGFARMPEGDLDGRTAADLLQSWCDEAGAHLWFDLEAFLFNPDGSLYPRDFESIRNDLLMFDNFEKVLCYQYPGVFNDTDFHPLVGEPAGVELRRRYSEYLMSKKGQTSFVHP